MADTIDIQATKQGPSGRPAVMVLAPEGIAFEKLSAVIQREITRNVDLRKKLGLKACTGCAASGIDLDIRRRFDHVLQVKL
jgi:hypothetical protein